MQSCETLSEYLKKDNQRDSFLISSTLIGHYLIDEMFRGHIVGLHTTSTLQVNRLLFFYYDSKARRREEPYYLSCFIFSFHLPLDM